MRTQAGVLSIAVVSPHLDDAIFSVGAFIASQTSLGNQVSVITVFGNDPHSRLPAMTWDAASGYTTAAEASVARRAEDLRACGLVGAKPEWLPFADEEYGGPASSAVWPALKPLLRSHDLTLIPGFPLTHPDHLWLTSLLLARREEIPRLGFYIEQPYANALLLGQNRLGLFHKPLVKGIFDFMVFLGSIGARQRRVFEGCGSARIAGLPGASEWLRVRTPPKARLLKLRAMKCYASQTHGLGEFFLTRTFLYELGWGGEALALPQGTEDCLLVN